MNKRGFLGAALATAGLPLLASTSASSRRTNSGPALLTVSGTIGKGNRGPLDPVADQLMKKHGLKFNRAHTFDFAGLTALPPARISPTLEYDGKPHALNGPLLADVLHAAGVTGATKVLLRAIDGYAAQLSMDDIRKYRMLVATHLDGQPMALGGLGPLWAVYDADRIPELAARPLNERFGVCPWGLYHIEAV